MLVFSSTMKNKLPRLLALSLHDDSWKSPLLGSSSPPVEHSWRDLVPWP